MIERFFCFIAGIGFLLYSFEAFVAKKVYFKPGIMEASDFNIGYLYIVVSILCLTVSIGFFYLALCPKSKKPPEFTKCHKCKESYYYTKTNKGKCPKCNVDTIEIEEYYKLYPKELKDAGK